MGKFLTDHLDTRRVDGQYRWILLAPVVYQTSEDTIIAAPEGFYTDLASIPKAFWSVLPPWGSYDKAAVIHDYLYFRQFSSYPREDADAVLLEAMITLGVNAVTRQTIYRAVRLFGHGAWDGYEEAKG